MIEWGCGCDMSCSGYDCWGGIHLGWWGTRVEDLAEVVWSAEVEVAGCFKEIVNGGV